jgi:hypothetical protein
VVVGGEQKGIRIDARPAHSSASELPCSRDDEIGARYLCRQRRRGRR